MSKKSGKKNLVRHFIQAIKDRCPEANIEEVAPVEGEEASFLIRVPPDRTFEMGLFVARLSGEILLHHGVHIVGMVVPNQTLQVNLKRSRSATQVKS